MISTTTTRASNPDQPTQATMATWADGQQTAVDSICRILARILTRLSQVDEQAAENEEVLQ